MKTWIGVLLVIATIIAPPIAVKALMPADSTTNDITISAVEPMPGGAVVSGSSTVAPGYTFSSITVYVRPSGGVAGEGGQGNTGAGAGSFTTTINDVPPGTYEAQAMLTVVDGSGNPFYFFSNTVMPVTVSPES